MEAKVEDRIDELEGEVRALREIVRSLLAMQPLTPINTQIVGEVVRSVNLNQGSLSAKGHGSAKAIASWWAATPLRRQ